MLHGECVQTYVPYLFLVIPLGNYSKKLTYIKFNIQLIVNQNFKMITWLITGPVTLTGQDYVLVESGCTCRPKYSRPGSEPNPASIIPSF